jgi:hypothetical protein
VPLVIVNHDPVCPLRRAARLARGGESGGSVNLPVATWEIWPALVSLPASCPVDTHASEESTDSECTKRTEATAQSRVCQSRLDRWIRKLLSLLNSAMQVRFLALS